MRPLADIAAALSVLGVVQALIGWWLAARFASQPRRAAAVRPPITVLKPLHGDEPLLEAALETVCRQDYPVWQVVFGVQDHADTALPVVRRLQLRFPAVDIVVVVDPTPHGANRKVANLINMLPASRHDLLVIADSDLHVAPDYLERLAAGLERPGTGLVTTLYAGLPPPPHRLPGLLGALQINQFFLPGALIGRWLGRQDCLGATMALRRATLERIGGLQALVEHLADDNVLGRKVAQLGFAVRLADTIPATTVPEEHFGALFRHELRWARTIRALVPTQFFASALQYPLVWAALAMVLSAGATWAWLLFLVAWAGRAVAARGIDQVLRLAFPAPVWLLPLRELMSVGVMVASYAGREVDWRGHRLNADSPPALPDFAAEEGLTPR
jgi:ceramide glucosyltransferase